MKLITKQQITIIHVLLNDTGLLEEKKHLIHELTNGRTDSSKDLTMDEAIKFIDFLKVLDGKENMRKKIFAIAYKAGIIYGETPEDKKMNVAKLNQFILHRGTVKKALNSMNKAELVKTVNQFESILKHNELSFAKKVTNTLLTQLNITVK